MRLFTTLSMCLICTAAFSQVPPPDGGTPPAINPAMQRGVQPGFNTMPGTPVTERSRVRAFNAGADGQIRSVYLSNGSVVDLSGFGPQFGSQLRKGNRIRLSGTRTTVNGQTIIIPQQITVNQQTYTAMANQGPLGQPGVGQPGPGQPGVGAPGDGVGAPPPGGPGAPPPPPPPPMAGGPGAPPPPPLGQNGPGRPGAGPRRGDARRPGAAAGQPVAPPADGTQPPPPPVAPATSVTPGTAAPVPPAATTDQTVNQ